MDRPISSSFLKLVNFSCLQKKLQHEDPGNSIRAIYRPTKPKNKLEVNPLQVLGMLELLYVHNALYPFGIKFQIKPVLYFFFFFLLIF